MKIEKGSTNKTKPATQRETTCEMCQRHSLCQEQFGGRSRARARARSPASAGLGVPTCRCPHK